MKLLFILIFLINLNTFASEEIPTKDEVGKLYVATFNRAPDYEGLVYWIEQSNLKLSEIAESFFMQTETQELYPESTTSKEFIKSVYRNLFNRIPDPEGSEYWEKELNEGKYTRNKFILTVINGAKDSEDGLDKTILENKNKVGLYFANLNLTDIDDAKLVLENVSSDTSSVDDSISIIDKLVEDTVKDEIIDIFEYKFPQELRTGTSTFFHYNYELLTYNIDNNKNFTFDNLYRNNNYLKNGYIIHDYIKRITANQFEGFRGTDLFDKTNENETFNKVYTINVSTDRFITTHYSNNITSNINNQTRYKEIGETIHNELVRNSFGARVYNDCILLNKIKSINFYDLDIYDIKGNSLGKFGDSLTSEDKMDYPDFKYDDIIVSRCSTYTENNLDAIVYSYLAKDFGTVINNTYLPDSNPNYSLYIVNPDTIEIR